MQVSSSNITSFNTLVICSVDFTGRALLIGGVNPLSGRGGGVPWLAGLAVTKDAGHLCHQFLLCV